MGDCEPGQTYVFGATAYDGRSVRLWCAPRGGGRFVRELCCETLELNAELRETIQTLRSTKLLTLRECSERSGLRENTWRDWILHRKVPFYKVGRSVRIAQSEWLGHSSSRITMDTYVHLMKDAQKLTAEAVFSRPAAVPKEQQQ